MNQEVGPVGTVGGAPEQHKYCHHCGRELPSGYKFCPYCGSSQGQQEGPGPSYHQQPYPIYDPYQNSPPERKNPFRDYFSAFSAWSVFALLLLTTVNVFILLWGISLVFPHTSGYGMTIFIITPFIVRLFTLNGVSFVIFYVIVALVITGCFLIALRKSLPKFKDELFASVTLKGLHTPLYVIGTLFFAVLSFNVISRAIPRVDRFIADQYRYDPVLGDTVQSC